MQKTITTVLSLFFAAQMNAQPLSWQLRYDRPAQYFEEALIIGNGTLGGIVYGGTNTDRVSLNDITLWTGEPCNMNVYSPDAHKSIPAIREALRRGDYREADHLQHDVQGHYSQNYQPLGQLAIELLPALPENWKDGTVRGIRARGGITVDMTWSHHRVVSYNLQSPRRCSVKLTVNGETVNVKLKKGNNEFSVGGSAASSKQ